MLFPRCEGQWTKNAHLPTFPRRQEGPAVILHAPATPGVLGALRDYMRVAVGSRLLLATLMGTLLHQPPALLLMQQIALMWLVRADYCR